ncbi:sensor histidine kinase [Candidatus Stoquefichus massiliensis]|uniref:sensor histidine kinase n=1 Tax=Candidatus Stoquefichus massiliensis TaxID=1470350 RepID=UPI000485087C|nr:HAMP domain-containing sensor histidine kinase [Candidatus Stoquefichus massiliensis]
MKTNNREFIQLRNLWLITILINIVIYITLDNSFLLVSSLVGLSILYLKSYYMLAQLYTDVRNVIGYASQDQKAQIKDGDLGLLYDEMRHLKNRTKAYEETIQEEKDKLKETIEDICHQLKTPLTSISIYNELILNEEENNENSQKIQEQIEKMKYLISSLLKLAKLQSHQVSFEYDYLPIKDVIELSLESVYSLIQQRNVVIKIEENHLMFYYDESWLQEAISNILKNALEHDCSLIQISFDEYQNSFKIKIYNDGPIIDEKDLPHIFERFYHTQHQKGVGIGLALSKEIIERHHGYIDVYNDHGVVFEIMFLKYEMKEKVS